MTDTHDGGRRRLRAAITLAAAVGACAAYAPGSRGAVKDWVGGTSTWDNGNAWNPSGQPANGDGVLIRQDGASVTYSNPLNPSAVYADLQIDAVGTTGAAVGMSLSSLNTNRLLIGVNGKGSMSQLGGAVGVLDATAGMSLGSGATGNGAYTLGGSAVLTVAGQVTVGELSTGSFTQTGGRLVITQLSPTFPGVLSVGANQGSNGTYTLSAGSVETGSVQLSPFGGAATFSHSGGSVVLPADLSVGDPALRGLGGSATYDHTGGTVAVQQLNIGSTGRFRHAGGSLRAATLTIDAAAGGQLDLADQEMVIDYATGQSPQTAVRGHLKSGYNGGAWNGSGINSSVAAGATAGSRAVAYGEASEVLGVTGTNTAQWNGQAVDGTSLLVRFTLTGDANLDGRVNFNDLLTLARNYNVVGTGKWTTADFNYDDNINFNDLLLLARNYNAALPSGPIPGATAGFEADLASAFASVPEPSALTAAGVLTPLLLRRRNPRRRD
jgi:hypothetical protein